MKLSLLIQLTILYCLLLACQSNLPSFSKVPNLTEASATRLTTSTDRIDSILLSVTYQDGDGDLGLSSGDTTVPYSETVCPNDIRSSDCLTSQKVQNQFRHNFFVFIKRQNVQGLFEIVNFPDNITFNARFPKLIDGDVQRPLSGEINNTLEIFYNFANSPFKSGDIIVFEVQIADRNLNLSNKLLTNMIKIGVP